MAEELDTSIYQSIRETLVIAGQKTYTAINTAMVDAYWEIGRQISEAQGERAEYGKQLLKYLSDQLTEEFGKGFDETNLRKMRQFYQVFPIRDALRLELSWTHYRLLMRVSNQERRDYYLNEAANENWSSRQLERQINSFYYNRLLATHDEYKESVKQEIQKLEPKTDPDYILKDPYILEFLDLKENKHYLESELEQALIDKLQEFLLELGKGFSFVKRQMRISENTDHYYIDLVFYNYILKCFVLIDLKTGKLTHQDVGQMDTYVRIFDEKIKPAEDNITIGLILCSEKSEAVVKYSVLADKDNLLASKYFTYLPTEEELSAELIRERQQLESEIIQNALPEAGGDE